MGEHTSTSGNRFASLEELSSTSPASEASTLSRHPDASSSSEHTHTPSASHGAEASSPSPHHLDLPPLSYYLGTPSSEHLDVSPSRHDSDALSFSPLLGTSHHIIHSPAPESASEQLAQPVSQQSATPTGIASTVEELARSGSRRMLGRTRARSASRANEMDLSAQRLARRDRIFDKAPGMMRSSWRSSQKSPVQPSLQSPAWEETPQHAPSSSQQHNLSSLQQPAPRSIVSDLLSILQHYNDSTDRVERALLGQIVEMVRKNEARYSHPLSHTPMLHRHIRVQSKGISDELVAYTVPPIVRLPSTSRHNARSRTEGDALAQVETYPSVFERLPPRPRQSSPSKIPRPVRSSSPHMHSPTRLGLHTPTSEARTASIENAFAYVVPPRRQHPIQYIVAKYAGPAFNASPSPSALPIPKFPPKTKRATSSPPPLCIVNGGPQLLDGQRLLLKPGPSANIRRPPSNPKANVVKSLREEILRFQCRSVPTRPPTPPLNNPSFGHKLPGGQGPLQRSESPNNMQQPITAVRGARLSVIKTADEMVVGSTQTSTDELNNGKAQGDVTTETAAKKPDTPATLAPPIARTAPQDILPQPLSRPTTPIALSPPLVMRNNSNARSRSDTPRPQTVRPPTNQPHRPPPIPTNRPPWIDLTDEEFEATRPVVEELGDRVVNLAKWREFQQWLGRKCMRGWEKFEREGGDERARCDMVD
jgi:hypothetical protein